MTRITVTDPNGEEHLHVSSAATDYDVGHEVLDDGRIAITHTRRPHRGETFDPVTVETYPPGSLVEVVG